LELPARKGWTWTNLIRDGVVVDVILDVAKEMNADLIVMATRGHDGFLDVLRGSTTERVLRGAACPLLTDIA
jgi:nucleotide-binding universal stress UspA family protein